jgi:asparagine synthase (glutamine-hydrolysing)
MCGIAGWAGGSPDVDRRQKVALMNRLQSHRGPDASGVFHDEYLALGHTRLSIIDPAQHSNQPFHSSDGRFVISFNGEIYNYRELRADLEGLGYVFTTTSDTEVLLESYRAGGERCLEKLEGMFAFGIYDRRTGRLFCGRDRVGEKPLYYAWSKHHGFVFASELRSIVQASALVPTVDADPLRNFLYTGYSKSPSTLVAGARQLPAGHFMVVEPSSEPKVSCYWSPYQAARDALTKPACDTSDFLSTFDSSVRLCTTADVAFGSFLSGGLDSTSVVDSIIKQGLGDSHFASYTLDYSEPSFSETAVVATTTQLLGVASELVPYEEYEKELPNLICLAATIPLADPSFLPLFVVARAAASRFKVMLGGDGGDELLLGYDTYRATRLSSMLGAVDLKALLPLVETAFGAELFANNVSAAEKLWRFASYRVPGHPISSHLSWRTIFSDAEISALLPDGRQGRANDWLLRQIAGQDNWPDDESVPLLARAAAVDYVSWMSDGVLRKLDSALMFNSVEGRSPFLNHRLIEHGFRLPAMRRAGILRGKLPLRRRLKDSGLSHVCGRQKRGFGFPLDRLFRGVLRTQLFDELHSDAASALFHTGAALRYLREHDEGRANHGRKLYCLLILVIWYRDVLGRRSA